MNYREATEFMYSSLPMYQRVGKAAFKKDLINIRALCQSLGNPQDSFRSVHIAGTNGKGSSAHMLAAILQISGYKTGLYTSPHLKNFTERIKINGNEIPELDVVRFVTENQKIIEQIKPSFFEITVAMAFDYFARQQVDIAIIETGLGGRLDSTNIINPELSLITNISLDHTEMLGNTIAEIAVEKGGIIKKHTPVVIGELNEDADPVFIQIADELVSGIHFAAHDYSVIKNRGKIEIKNNKNGNRVIMQNSNLIPDYQVKNILGVLKVCDLLALDVFTKISSLNLADLFEEFFKKNSIHGRWEVLQKYPLIICDTAHNIAGISEVKNEIGKQSFKNLHIVLGMVTDKDAERVLELLPSSAVYYFCQAKIPRAMPALKLKSIANTLGLEGIVVEDVNEAIELAKLNANEQDMIFIGGSTFIVAEINGLMNNPGVK